MFFEITEPTGQRYIYAGGKATLDEFMARVMPYFLARADGYEADEEYEGLVERIIGEEGRLG